MSGAVPVAVTESVVELPELMVVEAGWLVIVGAVAAPDWLMDRLMEPTLDELKPLTWM